MNTQEKLMKFKLDCEKYWKEQAKPNPNQLLNKPDVNLFKGYERTLAQRLFDKAKDDAGK